MTIYEGLRPSSWLLVVLCLWISRQSPSVPQGVSFLISSNKGLERTHRLSTVTAGGTPTMCGSNPEIVFTIKTAVSLYNPVAALYCLLSPFATLSCHHHKTPSGKEAIMVQVKPETSQLRHLLMARPPGQGSAELSGLHSKPGAPEVASACQRLSPAPTSIPVMQLPWRRTKGISIFGARRNA